MTNLSRRHLLSYAAAFAGATSMAEAAGIRALPQPDPALWNIDLRPDTEGTVPGPNGGVYYRRYGKPGRLPVIVLHGGPAAGETYMRPYASLAADREVILYDQSGCGRSARPTDLSLYTIDRYVDELEALRAHLGLDRIALVGHSWGALLAPFYVRAHPERVGAVVLAGGARRVQDYKEAATRNLRALGPWAVRTVRNAEASGRTDDPAYQKLVQTYYFRHLCRLDPWPAFINELGQSLDANPIYRRMNGMSEFDFNGSLGTLDLSAQLRAMRAPTLVTCGQNDEAPPWVARRIVALVPGATMAAFDGLGHLSHIEDPRKVVGTTASFLNRVA